ncbi:hypothetical protein ABTD77_20070, partial [Acinetobacter baumannii]
DRRAPKPHAGISRQTKIIHLSHENISCQWHAKACFKRLAACPHLIHAFSVSTRIAISASFHMMHVI